MYAGLTISDKPALLEAQKNGHTYIYLNHDGFQTVCNVNIALAQIAEMEREKSGCKYCKRLDIDELICYIPNDETGGFIEVPTNVCPSCGKNLKAEG